MKRNVDNAESNVVKILRGFIWIFYYCFFFPYFFDSTFSLIMYDIYNEKIWFLKYY